MERISLFLLFCRRRLPPHLHLVRGEYEAKVWLSDCSVAINLGFPARDLGDAIRKIREERGVFLEAWNDCFADRG
ncbi:MAG: DUF4160 domain-containing protein [Roseiarcus sp.]